MTLPSYSRTLCTLILAVCHAGADNIGLEINGNCSAGSCPAQALSTGASATLPVATSVTLANGDIYSITGVFASHNIFVAPVPPLDFVTTNIEVVYVGNAGNSPSQADSLTLDLLASYDTALGSIFTTLSLNGSFGPTVASSSSVELCVVGKAFCTDKASPPGAFFPVVETSQATLNGEFLEDLKYAVYFGAGSAVGSYILINDTPLSLPTISGVNSASGYGGLPNTAAGSWIEIYGSYLAEGSREWGSIDFMGSNAPTALGGTAVTVGGQSAFVYYVSPGQVDVQVPSNAATGAQDVIVTTAGGASVSRSITIDSAEPGLLAPASFLVGGKQYVVALYSDGTTYVLPPGAVSGITAQRAKPGDNITLYGIGFGPVIPDIPAGQVVGENNNLASAFKLSFGGTPAAVTYAGLASGNVGLYQFDVTVPSVGASDLVPVTFTLGGASGTQTLYIAIE
jgi:uncharacterized protein (TIGR03437 family)